MNPESEFLKRRAALRAAVALLIAAPLAGCLNVVDTDNSFYQYGAVTVRSVGSGTQLAASSSAIFFEALTAQIPDSRSVQNSCAISSVDTTTSVSKGDLKAGSALTLLVGANASKQSLAMPFNVTNTSYIGASGFTYSNGDSVTVSVPGETGGFSASSVTVRLAERLIPADITMPTSGQTMDLAWNPGDATSAIIVSIRYANPGTTSYANEQVLCSLIDDGSESIPSSAINAFLLSPESKRSVRFTRWRTNATQPTNRSLLHVVTTTDSLAKFK